MEMVCIVCPNGCRLKVDNADGNVTVNGAKCKRGENFAKAELACPVRSVTSSVRTTVAGYPVVSVRTDGEIPKDKIFALIAELSEFTLDKKVPIGTIIIKNVFGTGVNVITTTEML
ncbi:MAG: DUF1667 domain-containing protein [Corallococcus sp.]|nr:DUF1667 domain-containing protein [Bacillota bacterium]MCM1533765.1 DUF1667 domain-containing protein [Corallococcus sp.]